MSERELCAAFYLERSDDDSSAWAQDALGRIGVGHTWTWRPAGEPSQLAMHEVRYADWAGLRCEVRVMELEQLRVLLLVFLQSDFLDLVGEHPAGDDTTEVPVEEDGAIAVAQAFRDACGVLGPDVALIVSSPKADLDGYVAEQEAAVLTGDVLALIKAGLGLLYLSAAYASDIDPILAPDQRDELPVEAGRLIFAGTGPHRWWG